MKLNLTKPLVIFDLETTGLDLVKDRIIQISFIKVMPNGQEERGDELIFFTDGATEATNSYGEDFGKERLLKSIFRNADRPLTTQVNCIVSDILTFVGNETQKDDITLIILKKK